MELRNRVERVLRPAVFAGAGLLAVAGCGSDSDPVAEYSATTTSFYEGTETYDVVDVVDGDTVKLNYEGKNETVRIIGLDTPETVHPSEPVECFGPEASRRAEELLAGESVALRTDETQGRSTRDHYGRLLGHVILPDGRAFAEVMIREGYAIEYTHESEDYEYQDEYIAAQAAAEAEGAGLWADDACDVLEPNPADTPMADVGSDQTEDACEPDQIKANVNPETGEMIYHAPGTRYYDQTVIDFMKGEHCFATAAEAESYGWRPAN